MVCIVIITQIIKENKFSREKITEPAVVKYCDTVIKEKEIVWEKAVRRTKRAERSALESEKRFIFDGFFSVISVSAFPLNSQFCGQLFGRFRVLAYRTNNQALQKKNPQIFVLPAQESEDFGRSGGIRTHGLLDPNYKKFNFELLRTFKKVLYFQGKIGIILSENDRNSTNFVDSFVDLC